MANSPRNEMRPPEPRILCHGSPRTSFSTRPTCRTQRGYPAALAIAPYVLTRPRGTLRIAAQMAVTSGGLGGETGMGEQLAVGVLRLAFS